MIIPIEPWWQSDRVELFVLTKDHVSGNYVQWLRNPIVNRFLESRLAAHDIESTRAFVESNLASSTSLFLGIRARQINNSHVGNIKLGPIDRNHATAEVGIMIGEPAAWGKGLATEAIDLLSVIAIRQLRLRRLTAGCYASNVGSERAFQKAGFCVEGIRPGHFLLDGNPEALVLMGKMLVE